MTAYLWTMAAIQVLSLLAWANTKPEAPRKAEPTARGIFVMGILHTALLAWTLNLLFGSPA